MAREWDVLVIGAGAAGLTAATVAAKAGLATACVDKLGPGGMLMNVGRMQDWPEAGAASGDSEAGGADVAAGLIEAAMDAGVEMLFGDVEALAAEGEGWLARTEDEAHAARAVVLATGLSHGRLGVPGEDAFLGRGLSHCATCDGPLYAGQHVVVSGSDRWALQEAVELSHMAERVTLVPGDAGQPPPDLAGAGDAAVMPGRIVALKGASGVEGVVVEHDGRTEEIAADGVFAYRDRHPLLGFAQALVTCDAKGRVTVDDGLLARVPSLYAVGDARTGSPETAAAAVADGRRVGEALARLAAKH